MAFISLENRTIWIVGASTGIGRELTNALAGRNNHLIVTARNKQKLEAIATDSSIDISILECDISQSDSSTRLQSGLAEITQSLDLIVLNAGNCEYVDVDSFDTALFSRVFEVNMLGLVRCIEAALPFLRKSGKNPHIVGISSASAITGLPRAEAYGASKAAVTSFLESLSLDLHREGIFVSIVEPGFVDTPLARKNDFPMPFLMNVRDAVKIMINGIERRRRKVAFPRRLIWSLMVIRLLPASLRHRVCLSMTRR